VASEGDPTPTEEEDASVSHRGYESGFYDPPQDDLFAEDQLEANQSGETEEDKAQNMKDLFNKSQRTEFYTQKLEALSRSTEAEQRQLDRAVDIIQGAVRRWKAKRHREAMESDSSLQEELAKVDSDPEPRIDPLGLNMVVLREELFAMIDKQKDLLEWMQRQDDSQRRMQQELKLAKKLSMRLP